MFKVAFTGLVPDLQAWIRAAAKKDPGKGADLTLRLAEFYVPRLQRMTIDLTKMPLEEIAAELARREAAEKGADAGGDR